MSGEEAAELTPSREDLAALYRTLAARKGKPFGVQALLGALASQGFGLGRLLLCFDVLEERGLADCGPRADTMSVQVLPTQGKVDIFASPVFDGLRALAGK